MNVNRIYNVLLVEDDDIDIENVKRGFQKTNITNPLFIAKDGVEALEVLEKGIEFPLLILLDLKMPRMGGLEFLQRIRADKRWQRIPVVVLTSSKDEKDLIDAYKYNVAGYVIKPIEFGDFVEVLSKIGSYWMLCEFPTTVNNEPKKN